MHFVPDVPGDSGGAYGVTRRVLSVNDVIGMCTPSPDVVCCDDHAGRYADWGMDEPAWAQWNANGREIATEVDAVLGPWLDA
jgi:hypothetical protein